MKINEEQAQALRRDVREAEESGRQVGWPVEWADAILDDREELLRENQRIRGLAAAALRDALRALDESA